jgi:hypothetical protein
LKAEKALIQSDQRRVAILGYQKVGASPQRE